jgi:hypothetical protein
VEGSHTDLMFSCTAPVALTEIENNAVLFYSNSNV